VEHGISDLEWDAKGELALADQLNPSYSQVPRLTSPHLTLMRIADPPPIPPIPKSPLPCLSTWTDPRSSLALLAYGVAGLGPELDSDVSVDWLSLDERLPPPEVRLP
jgi:hypothetical protein